MKWIKASLIALLLLLAAEARGQTCTVRTVPVNFGSYDPLSPAPLDALGKANTTCSAGIAFSVLLGPGRGPGGRFAPRKMRRNARGRAINYNLYIDAARTQVWGDGTGTTFVQTGTGSGSQQSFNVYGRIPARQNVAVGHYTDSITVTVVF